MSMTLGIDFGTTKCAAVIYDTEKGKLLAYRSASHHADLPSEPGGAEQDPNKILDVLCRLILDLPQELRGQISAIGTTGQMHSVMGWNEKEIFPLVTWQDTRCGKRGLLEPFSAACGHKLYNGYGAATLAWLSGELDRWECASTIMDFIVCRLCGSSKPCTDPADAASWGIFDLNRGTWDRNAADRLHIPYRLLPEVRPSGETVGSLCAEFAGKLGLPQGIPVINATGDNQASILGTGNDFTHELFLTLGTGAQLSAVVTEQEAEVLTATAGKLELRPFFHGCKLAVVAGLCGGRAFAWLGDTVRHWLEELQIPLPSDSLLDAIDSLAMSELDSMGTLRVSPHFLGERGDEKLRGSIDGIDLANFTLGKLSAATLAGILDNLFLDFPEELLKKRSRTIGSGNGLRKVRSMRELLKRKYGMELILPDFAEEAACGAAILAGGAVK